MAQTLDSMKEKLTKETKQFIRSHLKEVSEDSIENILAKWMDYEDRMFERLEGLIQNAERRTNECTYRKMDGDSYFAKADKYVNERTKVAKWVLGGIGALLIVMITSVGAFLINKLISIEDKVILISTKLSVLDTVVKVNSDRITILDRKVFE